MFKAAKVRKSKTIRGQVYSRGNWTSEEVWVVYKSSEPFVLASSEVVLVCKRTGRVVYEGSANDEG